MEKEEYQIAEYVIRSKVIDWIKIVQIYSVAAILGVIIPTFVMHSSYMVLRKYARGWHSRSSLRCSLIGIVIFVGVPYIFQRLEIMIPMYCLYTSFLPMLVLVYRYAPADTEKNPLVKSAERRVMRKRAFLRLLILILFILFFQKTQLANWIFLGISVEILFITPLFYKLTKRSYRNYENYIEVS